MKRVMPTKEYALNINSRKLHKKDCRFVENFEETKWKDFHTVEEALKSCTDVTPCQKCFNGLKKFKKEK